MPTIMELLLEGLTEKTNTHTHDISVSMCDMLKYIKGKGLDNNSGGDCGT